MRKTLIALAVALAASLGAAQPESSQPSHSGALMRGKQTDNAVELKLTMRKLWEDHITFTRNYIISALADLPDADAVSKRLLKNQDDIGAAIKPFYGESAATQLSGLLREHIMIATEVVKAAKADHKDELTQAQAKWSNNGKEIAGFLAGANPYLPRTDLEAMLQKHLDLTTGEVVGRLKKDFAADIKSYDAGHMHMLKFADTLTDAIAKQFPDKVRGSVMERSSR